MKKALTILLVLFSIVSFSQDFRTIDWKTNVQNVQLLGVDTFRFEAIPTDINDKGADTREIGNYFIDFVARAFSIIDSDDSTITVIDLAHENTSPQTNQTGRVYQSVLDGDELFESIGGVDISVIDELSRWRDVARNNELFARAINSKQDTMPWDSVQFTLQSDLAHQEGKVFYDSIKHALSYYNDVDGVTVNMGLEQLIRVYNSTGDTVPNGITVAPSGDQFGNPGIVLADSRYKETSTLIAVVTNPIPPFSFGWVTKAGEVGGLNTLAYAGFKFLYLNGDGVITTTRPTGGHYETIIGSPGRIHATEGTIVVDIRTSAITVEQEGYTGWPDADRNSFPDNVAITMAPNRTIILTAFPDSTYYYYQAGEKYISKADTFQWSADEGGHLIFLDTDTVREIVNPTDAQSTEVLQKYPGIANVYWSVAQDTFIYVNNEFHNFDMNGQTRAAFHDIHACTIIDPIPLVDFDIDGTGNSDSHAQFGNNSGSIRNEDIKTIVPATASTFGYTAFYREGASGWRSTFNPGFGCINTGTGRIAYNELVGGSYQLTEVTNGLWVPYYLLVSNTLGRKYGMVPGDAQYANADDAVEGAINNAGSFLQNLPIKEIAAVAIVVFQTRDNYSNSVHGRLVSLTNPLTGDPVDYIDLTEPGISGGGQSSSGMATLTDDPNGQSSYASYANSFITVNGSETGWEFTPRANVLVISLDSTGVLWTQSQVVGLTDSLSAHDGRITQNESDIATLDSEAVKTVNSISPTLGNVDVGLSSVTAIDPTTTDAITVGESLRMSNNTTHLATKTSFLLGRHYNNSEEDVLTFLQQSNSSENLLIFGGGSSARNAATSVTFKTASNNTTLNGTNRLTISSTLANFEVPVTTSGLLIANGATFNDNVGIGTSPTTYALDVIGDGFRLSNNANDLAIKTPIIATRHYDNSEEDLTILLGQSNSSENLLIFGGGSSARNAATTIYFRTAATNTTLNGTNALTLTNTSATFAVDNIMQAGATVADAPVLGTDVFRLTDATGGTVNIDGATITSQGLTETSTFKMTTGATDGYILESDASGNGTWVAASGGFNQSVQTLTGSLDTLDTDLGVHGVHTMGTTNDTIFIDNIVAGMTGNIKIICEAAADTLHILGGSMIFSPFIFSVSGGIPTTNGAAAKDTYSWWYDGVDIIINGTKGYE